METLHNTDRNELAEQAVQRFFEALQDVLGTHDAVTVSLCGGSSVKKFYKHIPDYSDELTEQQWERVHFFWTDERLVPFNDDRSNFKQADELFLRDLGRKRLLLEQNVHHFPGDADDPEQAANDYTEKLEGISKDIHVPILGVGEDGHIASLFPGKQTLDHDAKGFLIEHDSPKDPKERMTLSPAHVRQSTEPFVFFWQERKREAYEAFKASKDYKEWPCVLAKEADEPVVVTRLK